MARSQATIIFAAALVVNLLLLSQSKLTNVAVQQHDVQDFGIGTSLFRRGLFARNFGRVWRERASIFLICFFLKFVVY
jgi:hypothetical protein